MYKSLIAFAVLILTLSLISLPLLAQDTSTTILQKAKVASDAGDTAVALNLLEQVMIQSAGLDRKAFGQSQGQYWPLIAKTNGFSRAYEFLGALAVNHPEVPDVLAAKGSAVGGYLGWLKSSGKAQSMTGEAFRKLDGEARTAYDRALQLDPDNFSALLGLAIYESYAPGGTEHSRALFHRLEGLRAGHPEYPWQMVDQFASQQQQHSAH